MADETSDKSAAKPITFTPSETKILLSIMQRLEGDLKFDAEGVAADCGLKNAKTAKDRWAQIKKAKIMGNVAAPSGDVDKRSPCKKAATKPKPAAATKEKGGRKSKAAKAAAKEDEDLNDSDDQDHEKLVKQEQLANSDEED